jgi:hypothetical protein
MANFKFNKVLNGEQVYGRNAKNDIAMYLFVVSARRASRHAGTDVRRGLVIIAPRRHIDGL